MQCQDEESVAFEGLDEYDALVFRVLGDGRKYIANIRTDNWITGGESHDVWQALLYARFVTSPSLLQPPLCFAHLRSQPATFATCPIVMCQHLRSALRGTFVKANNDSLFLTTVLVGLNAHYYKLVS